MIADLQKDSVDRTYQLKSVVPIRLGRFKAYVNDPLASLRLGEDYWIWPNHVQGKFGSVALAFAAAAL